MAEKLARYLCFDNILPLLIRPSQIPHRHDQFGIYYCALGGPGMGKTGDKVIHEIQRCSVAGELCILASPLNSVRKTRLKLALEAISTDVFQRRVRVLGARDLDDLAKTRTLEAITWGKMKDSVFIYEARMLDLWSAMMRAQAAQTIGDALGSDAIVAIIDVFGGFYEDLVRAHNEIALERVELSRLVKRVRQEVLEETSTLITTSQALTSRQSLVNFKRGHGDRSISLLVFDEITRQLQIDYNLFLMALEPWLTEHTHLAFAGDPCQTGVSCDSLPSTMAMFTNHGTTSTTMNWLLDKLVDQRRQPAVIVEAVDFVNRDNPSRRCRPHVARLVSTLAPYCLPKPTALWETEVDGKCIWSPLRPRAPQKGIDQYLDAVLPQIITYDPTILPWLERSQTSGQQGNSRYDVKVCLMASLTAVCIGQLYLEAKKNYPLANWQAHFRTEEEAQDWVAAKVQVQIISAYAAECKCILPKAVTFVREILETCATDGIAVEMVDIGSTSIDKSQGSTSDCTVLSLPGDTSDWTSFVADEKRVITMSSRAYYILALPRLTNSASPSSQRSTGKDLGLSIRVVEHKNIGTSARCAQLFISV